MSDTAAQDSVTPPTEVLSPDGVSALAGGGRGAVPLEEPSFESTHAEPENEIESPAKIIRVGSMVKQLLDEVRSTELDDKAREHLRDIYENSITELRSALSGDLSDELERLSLDFSEGSTPTNAELRVAQAQLVGWLEGLFHGIQATLVAQQMAARQQIEGIRGQLTEPNPRTAPGGPGYI
jgi:hypothetical protein